jgi:CheY-like chemotaxis protein
VVLVVAVTICSYGARHGQRSAAQHPCQPAQQGALIPAVALTAYARSEDRTLALRAGFDVHLTKPVEPAELLVVVASLVDGVRRRRV